MFTYGALTRGAGIDPRALTFAVLDVETTGLRPERGARVCEIAVVRMRGDGEVLDEYATLISPASPIRNDVYHGITDTHVSGAPTFPQVAGDVLARLGNAIVVGHNLEYDQRFLVAEFGRMGLRLQGVPALCTMVAARFHLDRYTYRLPDIATLVTDEWPAAQHTALGDTRATGLVLAALINQAPQRLSWYGPAPVPLPAVPPTQVIAPRPGQLRRGSEGWLATLTAWLPLMATPPAPRSEGLARYRALLAHALADGKIVADEAEQLAIVAARAGLTQTTARQVHEQFLAEARRRAEADGTVTPAELRELQRAAKSLAATHLIRDLEEAAAAARSRRNGPLKGWRIVPISSDQEATEAKLVELVDLAAEHGATVATNVTKTVRLVIAADETTDPRIKRAHNAGINVVNIEHAERLITAAIASASADQGLFGSREGEKVAAELAGEKNQAGRRPAWYEFWRANQLTADQYRMLFIEPYKDADDGTDDDDWDV
ncbi:exonuclease domain-containing protein [Actinoallomurus sp. NBC_01490]|uniref:exonuclease domain-containing protein n=1 Tax=Actinoallomurus sp. NBC_01490 TaxID=2903557 RepID=UPI002E30D5A2|nr:exonuclease domain-containing protein [Actinoallomurus sp. NBC_01490]